MMMNAATLGMMVLASALLAAEPTSAAVPGRMLRSKLVVPTVPPKADRVAKKNAGPPPAKPPAPVIPKVDQTGAESVKTAEKPINNEGDEGDEGNEGFVVEDVDFDEGNEGDEGDEGNEGQKEVDGTPRAPLPNLATVDGDEGDEGDEGGTTTIVRNQQTASRGVCRSNATASTYSEMTDAHVNAVASVMTEFCRDDFDGELAVASASAKDWGKAIVAVLTTAQAECITSGQAFGCASASSTALAWASATAEAHAVAVAASAEECDCLADAEAYAAVAGSEFVELIADAFARTEARACTKGNQRSAASAFASCGAAAYADVLTSAFARALLEGECWDTEVATTVGINIETSFRSIEGCELDDNSTGAANASTAGSTSDAVATATSPEKH